MAIEEEKIQDILVQGNYLSQDDFDMAQVTAQKTGVGVLEVLRDGGSITSDLIGQAVAESLGVPYSDLNSHMPSKEQTQRIPEKIAKEFRVVLVEEGKKNVTVGSDDPTKEGLMEAVQPLFESKNIGLTYSLSEDIDDVFVLYRTTLATRFSAIIEAESRVAPEIIDEIIADAVVFNASDIHFEPQEEEVVIRFRIDGMLQEAGRIPSQFYDSVLNRIKVQSKLRIDEHFSAQDGAIRYAKEKVEVDMRVSIVPTVNGEKVTLRLLSQYVRGFSLGDLGLTAQYQETLEKDFKKPFGMILVTGPTGSGKTTTLYAVLKELNHPEINITSIEDPVEYKMPGVNQIQVRQETDLTFAAGLRSIVRQDPDVILVGEIRDRETAEIAVNAALTGHLLLSTFHANDAATAIPRLLDMGIEPFLLSSTLEAVIAQRLVRKICEDCKVSFSVKMTDLNALIPQAKNFFTPKTTLYKGKGCSICNHTGYKGRIAIFEYISVSGELQNLMLSNPSSQDIWKVAKKTGAQTLFEDGVQKVKDGVTTVEELTRVAAPPKRL